MNTALEETLKGTRFLHRLSMSACLIFSLVGLGHFFSAGSVGQLQALANLDFTKYDTYVHSKIIDFLTTAKISERLIVGIRDRAGPYLTPQRDALLKKAFDDFEKSLLSHPPQTSLSRPASDATVGDLYRYLRANAPAGISVPQVAWLANYVGDAITKHYGSPDNVWQAIEIRRDTRAGQYVYDYQIYFSGTPGASIQEEVKSEFVPVDGTEALTWISTLPEGRSLARAGPDGLKPLPGLTGPGWRSIEKLTPEAAVQELLLGKGEISISGVAIDSALLLVAGPLAILGVHLYFFGYLLHFRRIWTLDKDLARQFPWLPMSPGCVGAFATSVTTWGVTSVAVMSLVTHACAARPSIFEWITLFGAGGSAIVLSVVSAKTIGSLRRETALPPPACCGSHQGSPSCTEFADTRPPPATESASEGR